MLSEYVQEGDVRIVIPSHKRADRVTTTINALPPEVCTLVVPAAQEAEYREHNPDTEIDAHPDDVIGMSAKRMWMAERYGDQFQCDDDQKHFIHLEHIAGERECALTPWEAYEVIQRTAEMARMMGVYLFSLSPYPDIRTFAGFSPFHLTGWVIGGKLGWLKPKESGLFIPNEITAKTDFWISALNAHKHRMCLVDMRYGSKFHADFGAGTGGGQATRRTSETEKKDSELLLRAFGSDVFIPKKRTQLSKGGSGHEDQITFRCPF
jgi:hypothetical protein